MTASAISQTTIQPIQTVSALQTVTQQLVPVQSIPPARTAIARLMQMAIAASVPKQATIQLTLTVFALLIQPRPTALVLLTALALIATVRLTNRVTAASANVTSTLTLVTAWQIQTASNACAENPQ